MQDRLRAGQDITNATRPVAMEGDGEMMAASNLLADRDEAFNTRYGSYRGWQMAIERVKPIVRHTARLDLAGMVARAELETPREVVDHFVSRFISVDLDEAALTRLAEFVEQELGTTDIVAARSYLEEPLRMLLHLILSLPEYQIG